MDAVKISNWFKSGKKYSDGVEILAEHIGNTFLITVLRQCDSSYTRKKLEEELNKLLESAPKEFAVRSVAEFLSLPEQVQKIKKEANLMFKEARDLHSRLLLLPEPERAKAAFRIKSIFKELDYHWYCLDFYMQHKRMPEVKYEVKEKDIEQMDLHELYKERAKLRTYVSKGKMKYQALKEKVEARYKSLLNAERAKKGN